MSELEQVAALCRKHDATVIADEVYEWNVYDDAQFTKMGEEAAVLGFLSRKARIKMCLCCVKVWQVRPVSNNLSQNQIGGPNNQFESLVVCATDAAIAAPCRMKTENVTDIPIT